MRAHVLVVALAIAAGCNKKSTSGSTAPGSGGSAAAGAVTQPIDAPAGNAGSAAVAIDAATTAAAPADPATQGRKSLDALVATFPDKQAALAPLFKDKTLVLAPSAREPANPGSQLAMQIPRLSGPRTLASHAVNKVVAGGSRGLIWFSAQLDLQVESGGKVSKLPIRVLELLDGSSEWKIAAASFGEIWRELGGVSDLKQLPLTTTGGPLAKMLTSTGDAAAALADDPNVVVMGTEDKEYAVGPAAAKKLLDSWKDLKLALDKDVVYEVHTADWGFALAHLSLPDRDGGPPFKMSGLLIAIPAGDSWKVVAVHFLPI